MKRYLSICIALVACLAAATYYFANQNTVMAPKALSVAEANLIKIGDRCVDFGERAVANDTPTIEFQKLQREANRSDVVLRCMTDNGYVQNPLWLKYAEPIAANEAASMKISVSEAMVNFSRKQMRLFEKTDTQPIYWIKKNIKK